MKANILTGCLAVFLAFSTCAEAKEAKEKEKHCTETMTVDECQNLFLSGPSIKLSDEDAKSARTSGRNDAIAGNDSGSSESSSSGKDFRARFTSLFEKAKLDDDSGALVLTWTPEFMSCKRFEAQLQSTVRPPKLYDKIEEEIPETSRAERKAALEKTLNDLDDVTVQVTISPQFSKIGRAFFQYEDKYDALRADIDRPLAKREFELHELRAKLADLKRGDIVSESVLELTFCELVAGKSEAKCEGEQQEKAQDWAQKLEEKAKELAAARKQVAASDRESAIWDFGALINNQPQITLTVGHDFRDDLSGPDGQTYQLGYEQGFPNLNSVVTDEKMTQKGITDYRNKLKKGHKLTFSLMYSTTSRLKFDIPGSEALPEIVSIDFDKVTTKKYMGTYSRSVTRDKDDRETSSFSFTAEYDDVSNDPKVRDRLIFKANYTTKVNDSLDLPLTLVYANHTRFLADEDHQITAHFAIRYKLAKSE